MTTPIMNALRRCPVGITVIALLALLDGILNIISSLITFSNAHAAGSVSAGISLLLEVILLALTYGLWMLKKWAFWATVIFEVVGIVSIVSSTSVLSQSGSLIFSVVIVSYLFADPHVRVAFLA